MQTGQQQRPLSLLSKDNQGLLRPSSISIQTTKSSSEPKRHPLRRDSIFVETAHGSERRDSIL